MGTTTFSGPIKAGSGDNVGYVTMAQVGSTAVAYNSTGGVNTGITIPAKSTIVGIQYFVDSAWTSSTTGSVSIGTDATANQLAAALTVAAANTAKVFSPVVGTWDDTGDSDISIWAKAATGDATAGSGKIVVEYIQANDAA
jgi:hypothetical protein